MQHKLAPLRTFIQSRRPAELRLSLREIEEIIGCRLPVTASLPRWWAGHSEASMDEHLAVWRELGYVATMSDFALVVTFSPMAAPRLGRRTVGALKEMVFPSAPKRTLAKRRVWRPDRTTKRH